MLKLFNLASLLQKDQGKTFVKSLFSLTIEEHRAQHNYYKKSFMFPKPLRTKKPNTNVQVILRSTLWIFSMNRARERPKKTPRQAC